MEPTGLLRRPTIEEQACRWFRLPPSRAEECTAMSDHVYVDPDVLLAAAGEIEALVTRLQTSLAVHSPALNVAPSAPRRCRYWPPATSTGWRAASAPLRAAGSRNWPQPPRCSGHRPPPIAKRTGHSAPRSSPACDAAPHPSVDLEEKRSMTIGVTGVVWMPRGATVNSTTLSAGAGPVPLGAASPAWAALSASLADAGATLNRVMTELRAGWEGWPPTPRSPGSHRSPRGSSSPPRSPRRRRPRRPPRPGRTRPRR